MAKDTLLHEVSLIFDTFSIILNAVASVKAWAHEATKSLYMRQAQWLTHSALGFHFNVQNTTAEHIEQFSMEKLTHIMEIPAPELCDMVESLLASDPGLDALRVNQLDDEDDGSTHKEEPDLRELGREEELWAKFPPLQPKGLLKEDIEFCMESDDDMVIGETAADSFTARQCKLCKAAVEKRIALKHIVSYLFSVNTAVIA
jgi:hypothetical protein